MWEPEPPGTPGPVKACNGIGFNFTFSMRMEQFKNTYIVRTWEVWHKQALCWRGHEINVCVVDNIYLLRRAESFLRS
jgi:hypothetical protein